MTAPTMTVTARANRPLAAVWDAFVPISLTEVFAHRKGPIPPVVDVRDQTGRWDKPGETRQVLMSSGMIVREEITYSDPTEGASPSNGHARFAYKVTGMTGALGLLTKEARGSWTFTETGEQTDITWTYTFTPTHGLARPFLALLIRTFWKAYMQDGMSNVVKITQTQ